MTLIGLLWQDLSLGFADGGGGLCRDLLSSGGDDDAMMLAFSLFALPLLLRLIRLHQFASRWEIILLGLVTLLGLASLWLATLDCARVFATALGRPDIALLALFLALALAWAMGIRLMRPTP